MFFVWEEIIQNSCGPTGINLNPAPNIGESRLKIAPPARSDVYTFEFSDSHTKSGCFCSFPIFRHHSFLERKFRRK